MTWPDLGLNDDCLSGEDESVDRLGDTGLVLMPGYMPAAGLETAHRVTHDDRQAGVFEHPEIIEVVADGHHLRRLQPERTCAAGERQPFGRSPRGDVEQREIAVLVFGQRHDEFV